MPWSAQASSLAVCVCLCWAQYAAALALHRCLLLVLTMLQLNAYLYVRAVRAEQLRINALKVRLTPAELNARAELLVRYVARLHLAYDVAVRATCALLR